eukprot:TRINITY_DN1175_c0_g3_i1.p1 TRINITY_DN1175_c0_g3~~TRINITY_DN1175_c0_g3_i1.p1  ORF type:complete len:828 (-),score=148.88 TRINITY_DN1175_c0_g3_i1:191-2674(-)
MAVPSPRSHSLRSNSSANIGNLGEDDSDFRAGRPGLSRQFIKAYPSGGGRRPMHSFPSDDSTNLRAKMRINHHGGLVYRKVSTSGDLGRSYSMDPRDHLADLRQRLHSVASQGEHSDGGRLTPPLLTGRRRGRTELAPGLSITGSVSEMVRSALTKVQTMKHKVQEGVAPVPRHRMQSTDIIKDMTMHATDIQGTLQIQDLGGLGFTTEDLSRVFYQQLRDHDLPIFLDHICFHKDGGLGCIADIWHWQKYIWFFLMVASVLCNITFIVSMNRTICESYLMDLALENASYDYQSISSNSTLPFGFGNTTTAVADFKHIHDDATRRSLLNLAALVAIWEMMWIFVKAMHLVWLWWQFVGDSSEYRSFRSIMFIFQKLLPQFGTFSAIKLIAKVHPSLFYNEYLHYKSESVFRGSWMGSASLTIMFTLRVVACGVAALAAFSIKLLAVGLKLVNPNYSIWMRVLNVFALLNQCMGVVLMEIVLQDRLFLFVFGGNDAEYRDDEQALKNVYEARLARCIWENYWKEGFKFRAITMLATFDHYDLQKLLVEDLEVTRRLEMGMPTGGGVFEACPEEDGFSEADSLQSPRFGQGHVGERPPPPVPAIRYERPPGKGKRAHFEDYSEEDGGSTARKLSPRAVLQQEMMAEQQRRQTEDPDSETKILLTPRGAAATFSGQVELVESSLDACSREGSRTSFQRENSKGSYGARDITVGREGSPAGTAISTSTVDADIYITAAASSRKPSEMEGSIAASIPRLQLKAVSTTESIPESIPAGAGNRSSAGQRKVSNISDVSAASVGSTPSQQGSQMAMGSLVNALGGDAVHWGDGLE